MSVLRQLNILGQMRLDVPHLRSIESSIAADFDVVAGRVQAGGKAVVVRGFALANFDAGTAANSVQLTTADGILYNMNASESGTFLWVPADRDLETLNSATNARVSGSFTAGQVNYVGLDFIRTADATTTDLVQFLDPNTLLENAKSVPLGRTLDYRIVISTTPFSSSPNLVPIAKIKTDVSNNVDGAVGSVQDARNIIWRLGSGGDFPNRYSSFTWAQNRVESITGSGVFVGGDKGIQSQKDWMDAVMTRLWEIGGGENWYSTTADRNVRMIRSPGVVFGTTGDNFEWIITNLYVSVAYPRHLHWQGLKVVFDNSNTAAVYYNTVTDQTMDDFAGSAAASKTCLADGDCIYVDIDRTSNAAVVAKKAALQTLSVPAIPGSRIVLAWRIGADVYTRDASLAVNVSFQPATTTVVGAVRLNNAPNVAMAGTPTVFTLDTNNSLIVGGVTYPIVGSNPGAVITGGGSGNGVTITGGPTGFGAVISAGATGGTGANIFGTGAGLGAFIQAQGSGMGLSVSSITGKGLQVVSTNGDGATIAAGVGSRGLDVTATTGQGVRSTTTSGEAFVAATTTGRAFAGITAVTSSYAMTLAQTGAGGGLSVVLATSNAIGISSVSVGSGAAGSFTNSGGTGTGVIGVGGGSTFGQGIGGHFTGGSWYGVQAVAGAAAPLAHGIRSDGNAAGSYGIDARGGDVNAFTVGSEAAFNLGYGVGGIFVAGQQYGGVGVAGFGGGSLVSQTLDTFSYANQGGYFVGVSGAVGGSNGMTARGGQSSSSSSAGWGATIAGGFNSSSGLGGLGAKIKGGNSTTGSGGLGLSIIAGTSGAGAAGASGAVITATNAGAGVGLLGGTGLTITAGTSQGSGISPGTHGAHALVATGGAVVSGFGKGGSGGVFFGSSGSGSGHALKAYLGATENDITDYPRETPAFDGFGSPGAVFGRGPSGGVFISTHFEGSAIHASTTSPSSYGTIFVTNRQLGGTGIRIGSGDENILGLNVQGLDGAVMTGTSRMGTSMIIQNTRASSGAGLGAAIEGIGSFGPGVIARQTSTLCGSFRLGTFYSDANPTAPSNGDMWMVFITGTGYRIRYQGYNGTIYTITAV